MANFVLYGKEPGVMGGYREGLTTSYLPRTLQEELLKAQLANKYYGPDIESQIGLRGAQGNLANANAYLHQQQGNWVAPQAQANIGNLNASSSHYGYQNRLLGEQIRELNRSNTANAQLDDINRRIFEEMNKPQGGVQNIPTPTLGQINTAMVNPQATQQMNAGQPNANTQAPNGNIQDINQALQSQRNAPVSSSGNPALDNLLRQREALMGMTQKGIKPGMLSPEEKIAYKIKEVEEIAKAKELNEVTKGYAMGERYAADAKPKLQQLENALNKLPSHLANSWSPKFLKEIQNNPDYQVAIKSMADLMLGELKPLFGGMGQIRVKELEMLAAGTPGPQMSPKAFKQVADQVRTGLEIKEQQGRMSNKLKHIPGITGEDINGVIAMASRNLSPIDSAGNHPERLKDWMKYVTPEAVMAVRRGINYIPEVNPNYLSNEAIQQLLAEGRV